MSAIIYSQQQQQQQRPHFNHPAAHLQFNNPNNYHRSRRGGAGAGAGAGAGGVKGVNNIQRQFRGVKSMRELAEAPAISAFRARFEAGRSFDLDDDLEFCPGLLTEDDVSFPFFRPFFFLCFQEKPCVKNMDTDFFPASLYQFCVGSGIPFQHITQFIPSPATDSTRPAGDAIHLPLSGKCIRPPGRCRHRRHHHHHQQ